MTAGWEEVRKRLLDSIVVVPVRVDVDPAGTSDLAAHLVNEYDATWGCEYQSETWYDCPTEFSADPRGKHRSSPDLAWCRSCVARKTLGIEDD